MPIKSCTALLATLKKFWATHYQNLKPWVKYYFFSYRPVLVLLIGLTIFKIVGNNQVNAKAPISTIIQLEAKRELITTVIVETSYALVQFAKIDNNTWIVETSEGERAYQVAIDRMNELLRFLSSPYKALFVEGKLDEKALSRYGLDHEKAVKLTVITSDKNKKPATLLLGSHSPNGYDVYIYYDEKVYRSPISSFYTMINTANSWITG